MTNIAAKSAASQRVTAILPTKTSSILALPLISHLHQRLPKNHTTPLENETGKGISQRCSFNPLWLLWIGRNCRLVLPNSLKQQILTFIHNLTHWNTDKMFH